VNQRVPLQEDTMAENSLSNLEKIDPEMMKRMHEMEYFVFSDGALSRKVKLLIALAFDAAHGTVNGVRTLANFARKEGASSKEIAEALRVAYHLNGVGTLYVGSQGLGDAEGRT
jgi:alkylhydroperoxidase/carboxymuconolactone decarboxylase family protein YurZ